MKRVVHLFNSSIVSGPETLVIPALPGLKAGVSVIFLTEARRAEEAKGPVAYSRSFGLDTRQVPVRSRIDLRAVGELARLLAELNPDIVHAHDVKASTYLLKASGRIPGRRFRIFSTHHGVRGRSGFRARLYEKFYARFVLPRFDRILTVCTSDRALLAARGIPEKLLRVHLNGVDRPLVGPAARAAESERIRAAWGLAAKGVPPGAPLIGFVGRIAPEKRLDRILAVVRELDRLEPELPWFLVPFGTGPLEPELHALTRELGLDRRVRWMGYRSGLGKELAGFDLLISLSDAEGLPINLIEAGWAGTPVFATAVDGNHDLIPSRNEGHLVAVEKGSAEIAAELLALLKDKPLCQKMGAQFQNRVRSAFSGRRWLDELERLYQEP